MSTLYFYILDPPLLTAVVLDHHPASPSAAPPTSRPHLRVWILGGDAEWVEEEGVEGGQTTHMSHTNISCRAASRPRWVARLQWSATQRFRLWNPVQYLLSHSCLPKKMKAQLPHRTWNGPLLGELSWAHVSVPYEALCAVFHFSFPQAKPHSTPLPRGSLLAFFSAAFFSVRSVAAAATTAGRLRKIRPPSSSSMPLRAPTPTTISTSTPGTARGRHVFEINGYSKHRGMGSPDENFVRSGTFSVGGYYWSIRFYPDGNTVKEKDYISVYLELMRDGAKVRASCDLRLVDQTTGLPSSVHTTELRMFSSSDASRYAPQTSLFKKRSELEDSGYLQDDRLVIDCVITVVTELRVSESKFRRRIEVPPSDIGKCLGKLLEAEEGADVTFSVGGETFAAHKLVLAMRSPVFRAELYGPMREGSAKLVAIEDMQPAVFRALLHFIYTDSLPDMDDLGQDANCEMMRHLLVAANRYGVDRLKLVCQSILCENIDVKNVATTLGLAYQHDCNLLYDVCLEYMSSSNVMDAVVATQGYKNLKTTCPSALADALEKSVTLRKA